MASIGAQTTRKGKRKRRTKDEIEEALRENELANATPGTFETPRTKTRRKGRRRKNKLRLQNELDELAIAQPDEEVSAVGRTINALGELAITSSLNEDVVEVARFVDLEETKQEDANPDLFIVLTSVGEEARLALRSENDQADEQVGQDAQDQAQDVQEQRRLARNARKRELRAARTASQKERDNERRRQQRRNRQLNMSSAENVTSDGHGNSTTGNTSDGVERVLRDLQSNQPRIAADQVLLDHDAIPQGNLHIDQDNEDEEEEGSEEADQRANRRRRARYKHALKNHEDFDISAVSGANVVNGRHKLPPPTDTCTFCNAWKWPGESKGGCCLGGKVVLPRLGPAPRTMQRLLRDPEFRRLIRAYNNAFAFVSVGASFTGRRFQPVNEDRNVQGQHGVYTFKIQGAMGHLMGSLLPYTNPVTNEPEQPAFAQIYVNDPDMQARAERRAGVFAGLNLVVLLDLETMLQEINPFAREFVSMGERIKELTRQGRPPVDIAFRLRANNREGSGTHNLPACSEVAAIQVDDANAQNHQDLILYARRGGLLRLFETNPIADPCGMPLLLVNGELGYGNGLTYANGAKHQKKTTMSLREHTVYRLYQKADDDSVYHQGGRLFQQNCVMQRAKCEQEQLRWVATHQVDIRADLYKGVEDAYMNERPVQLAGNEGLISEFDRSTGNFVHPDRSRSHHFLEEVGKRVILPASHTGSERYMYEQYQNSMAMVRAYGKPDLFITMTCNPNWEEIRSVCERNGPHQTAQDRPDVVARVWNLKLKALLKDLDEGVLGLMIARIYVIDFQKRGLPHAHILIMLADADKPKTRHDYDLFVSAEVPDEEKNPALYETVLSTMVHGPCGTLNPRSPCMKNDVCSKGFPKPLASFTQTSSDGFPLYRRRARAPGVLTFKGKVYDNATINQWIVPYNPYFTQKFDCHINVEICSTIHAIKYLYKYVYKGSDRTEISLQAVRDDSTESSRPDREPNEIIRHIRARYISPVEACQRIFDFPIQGKTHRVVKLAVHLPNSQFVTFRRDDDPQRVLDGCKDTTLTQFFKLAASDAQASRMLYIDIPTRFRWDKKDWAPYIQKRRTIGRMVHVSPQDPERFYLRILLCHRRGPTSYEDLRTVDGHLCATFKEAAMRAGYLDDDQEWMACMEEASQFHMPYQLRQLFATILLYSLPTDAFALWERFYDELSRDYAFQFRDLTNRDEMVKFKTLESLHTFLAAGGKALGDYSELPQLSEFPDLVLDSLLMNNLIRRELEYDMDQLRATVENVDRLNPSQRRIYDEVIEAVNSDQPSNKLFFIDGPGGTGKSTLLNHILAKVRFQGQIAIAVASSGIASLLLPGGRTAHSTFKIPLKLEETSVCHIPKQSNIKKLFERAALIVWDEAPMTHRFAFEAVDRSLRDILNNPGEPFGGKKFVLSGDFRQILPVVKKGMPADTIQACLKSSPLWRLFRQLRLTVNMRVQMAQDQEAASELASFSEFLLRVGEGRHDVHPDLDGSSIKLPSDMVIALEQDEQADDDADIPLPLGLMRIVDAMYSIADMNNPRVATDDYFASRSILAPTNSAVQRVNEAVAERLQEQAHEYLSTDSVEDTEGSALSSFFETEVLNSINLSGIPPHRLVLKKGVPIMMIRNLNPDGGLCNGTRLRVVQLKRHVIYATIMTGAHAGKEVLIPRITFISTSDDQDFPFHLRRKQFPVVPAFAMTINKAQGQTVHNLGLYLPTPCFSHGQLYVALSRVTSRSKFKAVIENPDMEEEDRVYTTNVVYREIFLD